MIRKWQSLIETHVDAKTNDGYILRIFVIAFTKRLSHQKRKSSYAQRSQIKDIRKKINEIVAKEVASRNISDLLSVFISDSITKEITKKTRLIFPLQNITIRKVKCIKRPKIDSTKMNEMYQESKRSEKVEKSTKPNGNEEDQAENLLKKK